MARREYGGARRARGQDPRDARAEGAGPASLKRGTPLDAGRARLVAADLLSRRPWTAATLAARLVRRGASDDVARGIVDELVRRGHVDDAAFARHWVETRARRGYGAARLAVELRQRGVVPELVAAALAGLEPGAVLAQAREVARRRLPALRARGDPARLRARLAAQLLRRGFSPEIVRRVVADATGARVSSGDQAAAEAGARGWPEAPP